MKRLDFKALEFVGLYNQATHSEVIETPHGMAIVIKLDGENVALIERGLEQVIKD